MTKKLFYDDPYLRSFSAAVVRCEPEKEHWRIILDATAFYPEGGGQPGDTGYLDAVQVLDTREQNGEVVHMTAGPLESGAVVKGVIDWEPRFSRMQHHTGEHIVSGILHRLHGCDNVGFHMGRDAVTIDLSMELSPDALLEAERLANQAVWQNIPVSIQYPSSQELAALNYRSKKELTGAVRIVTVPGSDVCACCGLHVSHTGEVGIIKLVNAQRYKGGSRVWLLCGDRALEDYVHKNRDIFSISALLSAKPHETVLAVQRLLEERDFQKAEISQMRERLCQLRAAQTAPMPVTIQFVEELSPAELRNYCLALCERCGAAAVFSGQGQDWKYAIGSKTRDVRPLGKQLNSRFSGRGGGKSELIQGSLTGSPETIEAAARHELEA